MIKKELCFQFVQALGIFTPEVAIAAYKMLNSRRLTPQKQVFLRLVSSAAFAYFYIQNRSKEIDKDEKNQNSKSTSKELDTTLATKEFFRALGTGAVLSCLLSYVAIPIVEEALSYLKEVSIASINYNIER